MGLKEMKKRRWWRRPKGKLCRCDGINANKKEDNNMEKKTKIPRPPEAEAEAQRSEQPT